MTPTIVGIDLGTTNSAVAFVERDKIKLFRIPQLNVRGVIEASATLPSFYYLAEPEELPNSDFAVGEWAREQGAKVPTRLIQSAKSWLSSGVCNRKEKILPFEAVDQKRRLSPVEATASYLRHMREAWNKRFKEPLEEQEVILTVPASFDEVARGLTVEAAHIAGIPQLTLLEEPQAAFYNWLSENEKKLDSFNEKETILVCDVGGGTTDFSLIEVGASNTFQRMAVGKHLLLGGDNMDAALCRYLETQMNASLESSQWRSLLHQVRAAKETILAGEKRVSLWIEGKGSRVVGGGKGVELTEEEVGSILLEEFFGLYEFDQACLHTKESGVQSMGLPYEKELSITKHLATFLSHHKKPTYILFNGGSMKPSVFQERIVQSLDRWYPAGAPTRILPSSSLDLAVARGAAYYGKVRQGEGIRIGGGTPRGYYLEVEEGRLVTLLPRGTDQLTSTHTFSLLPNRPVSFQLYTSHVRMGDAPGSSIDFKEEEMTPLPPIQTVLRFGNNHQERIPVKLSIAVTEIGTLELWLTSQISEHRWKLEFQLGGHTKEKRLKDETFDVSFLDSAKETIINAFAAGGQAKLKMLMPSLENVVGRPRAEWSPSILRGLFEPLLLQSEKRNLAQNYASRFWNLAGFLLRPGRGYPLDDFRIQQLWKLILADLKNGTAEEVQIQKWICFRRIAAGLAKGQQVQIYNELFPLVYDKKKRRLIVKRKGGYAYAEQLRALASLELIDLSFKEKLGGALVDRIVKGHGEVHDFWALGRLGARELLYGSVANVVRPSICEEWVARLVKISEPELAFPLTLLARQTACREVNLSASTVEKVKLYLDDAADLSLLLQKRELTFQEQEKCFGDSLPPGLLK